MTARINIKSSLRQAIAKRGWTQKKLASVMGVSESSISEISASTKLSKIQSIADALEIKASEFIALGEG